MTNLSKDLLRELFDYKNGQLINKYNRRGTSKKGDCIGCVDKSTGYIRTMVQGTNYRCHRLIWNWHNGDIPEDLVVDHINGDKSDNRIENLRLLTQKRNLQIAFERRKNKTETL